MKKKYIIRFVFAVLVVAFLLWIVWGNVTVGLTTVMVTESDLPSAFDGYRIAHASDLHNTWLWKHAIQRLKEAKPDIICITGDIVDSDEMQNAFSFVEEAVKIAPCYYITGNHEMLISQESYSRLLQGLKDRGVSILMDESVIISRAEAQICLTGHKWGNTTNIGQLTDFEGYNLLLSHHPEGFSNYVAGGYDLVLCGHAHGGQVRLPFIGGLFAPGQGILPEYDSGVYSSANTDMVVSRGIGNSSFPIRFNNRPEVIVIVLSCDL